MDGDLSAGGPRSHGAAAGGEGGPVTEVNPAPREQVPCRGPPQGAGEVSDDGERVLAAGLGKRGAGLRRRCGGPFRRAGEEMRGRQWVSGYGGGGEARSRAASRAGMAAATRAGGG
jgi:hypothetical protein